MAIQLLFYRFPLRNSERNAKWIKAVGQKGFIPTKKSWLYKNHFLKTDFKTSVGGTYKLLLSDDAVPSIFNMNVVQTPTKIYCSEICKPTSSELTTTKLSTSVQDEPLCLTPKTHLCFKSAEEEFSLISTPSKFKLLKQQIRRKDTKINTLAGLLKLLKDKKVLNMESEELILDKFDGLSQELFSNIRKNQNTDPKGRRYSKTIKEFSLTLNYYSPKAYEYARLV
ncbi:THAP domain-containing protein 2-like [Rhopalosiphum maidis]|uniref:THAP domain-containing protein 2-like n=1 Tax=Rhopalosiphum maidis TaxID=43146 RepID=UPI000F0089DE|nr:THAP domain-containing protein 2-like [Rhopalosiphum maidis]